MTVSLREKLSGELEDREIYFIKNEEINLTSTNPKYFQFLIPERTIHVITAEETEQVFKQGGLIIINPEDGDMADLLESSEKVKKIDSSLLLTAYVVE